MKRQAAMYINLLTNVQVEDEDLPSFSGIIDDKDEGEMVSTPGGELVKAYSKKVPDNKSRINIRIRILNHIIAVSEMEKEGTQLPTGTDRKRRSGVSAVQNSEHLDGFTSPGGTAAGIVTPGRKSNRKVTFDESSSDRPEVPKPLDRYNSMIIYVYNDPFYIWVY
jgi:hypothetical protein